MKLRRFGMTVGLGVVALSMGACCWLRYRAPKGAAEQPQVACSTTVLEGFGNATEGCPDIPDFYLVRPFVGLSGDIPQASTNLEVRKTVKKLERFCRYYSKTPEAVAALGRSQTPIALTRTCPVVATQQTTQTASASKRWDLLAVPTSQSAPPSHSDNNAPVTIAIVDTAESARIDVDGHGHTVGAVARLAACKERLNCDLTIIYESAMPLSNEDLVIPRPGTATGTASYASGHLGTPSTLAEAIVRVLKSPKISGRDLVINLSIGWERSFGEGLVEPTDVNEVGSKGDAGAHAAVTALLLAYQLNYPVFAATGNRAGPSGQRHSVLPAGYASKTISGVGKGALVTPVSAVDFKGRVASMQRLKDWSVIAAPSVHFEGISETGKPLIRSGTSIATAVASGFAARLRAAGAPGVDNYNLPKKMYATGKEVRDASGAFIKSTLCPPSSDTTNVAPFCRSNMRAVGIPDSVLPLPPRSVDPAPTVGTCDNVPPVCKAQVYRANQCPPKGMNGDSCGAYCPHLQMNGREALPWVGPHPPIPLCPDCYVFLEAFNLSIPEHEFEPMIYPKLVVETSIGTYYFDLAAYGYQELASGAQGVLQLDFEGKPALSAALSYVDPETEISYFEEIALE